MKNMFFAVLAVLGMLADTSGYAAPARRNTRATSTASAGTSAPKTTAARSAVSARSARGVTSAVAAPTSGTRTMGARSATSAKTVPTVAARAATTQKVIGTGSKVSTAAKNIIVDEECQAKYDGCMDAFCMMDNANGGRCICSNRIKELDAVLAEIEKLDEQSYQMATLGVEKLEMGLDADDAINAANAVADSLKNPKKSARKSLDLDMWSIQDEDLDDNAEDIFAQSDMSVIDGKEGDALYRAANDLCKAQIPECKNSLNMLDLMYAQKIKSDCTAYENSLKQKRNQSAQKLNAAERALRETALEQYQNANKYDLGQCMIKFKECMQTTAECGDDFSKCASVVAMDMTNVRKSSANKNKNFKIKGAVSTIEISASTYDTLVAKKPLCETVTKQCTKVADQVWDAFLKEVAPDLKSAEIIAEDNARQNCIGNISACFQKACKDNINPNDPDGSYDMCLSRPETMLNLCKVPLNACGIDASSTTKAQQSSIWEYVVAALAAQRVDACTIEVKECLQDDNRCGKDYAQCVGLDTDTIMAMCPRDKLVACYSSEYKDEDERTAYIERIAQGIMLNIDNNMLLQCQNALDKAMVKVCGDTESCENMTIIEGVGSNPLEYKVCEYSTIDNVYYKDETGREQPIPGVAGDYVFSNCKQDIGLIMDEDLLGKVEYDGESNKILENLLSNELKLTAEEVSIELKKYSDYKQYMSVIGGVIDWNEIKVGLGAQCYTEDGEQPQGAISVYSYLDGNRRNGAKDKVVDYDMCFTGIDQAAMSNNFGQNGSSKQAEIRSDIGALVNSVVNTIRAIEADPTVQFCMTGRKVQGLKIDTEEVGMSKSRFPYLTEQVKIKIAESALKKAKDNYNTRYAELDEKMRKESVKLAERIAKVRQDRSAADRAQLSARACLSLGSNAALPVMSYKDEENKQFAQGYVATNTNEDGNYRETVTATFNPTTLVCTKCTRIQTCEESSGSKSSKYCDKWNEPTETCTETQF